jgi:hypothetical protein
MKILPLSIGIVLTGFLIAGCESPSSAGSASGEGRERLSINKSYAEMGDYVVLANAMTTAELAPEIAQIYGITRSENSGLINIVVLRKSGGVGLDQPTRADIDITAANLTGQLKSITLREIEDDSSIYYIGEVSIDDQETINFDFDVLPEGEDRPYLVRFSHQFYTQ